LPQGDWRSAFATWRGYPPPRDPDPDPRDPHQAWRDDFALWRRENPPEITEPEPQESLTHLERLKAIDPRFQGFSPSGEGVRRVASGLAYAASPERSFVSREMLRLPPEPTEESTAPPPHIERLRQIDPRFHGVAPTQESVGEFIRGETTPFAMGLNLLPALGWLKKALPYLKGLRKVEPAVEAVEGASRTRRAFRPRESIPDPVGRTYRLGEEAAETRPAISPTSERPFQPSPSMPEGESLPSGFRIERSERTPTVGLHGPKKEKVGVRVLDDRIEVTTVGKGESPDSRTLVQAMRELAEKEGKDVYFTSTNLTDDAVRWRERMLARGDMIQTEQGLKLVRKGLEATPKGIVLARSGDDVYTLVDNQTVYKNGKPYSTLSEWKGPETPSKPPPPKPREGFFPEADEGLAGGGMTPEPGEALVEIRDGRVYVKGTNLNIEKIQAKDIPEAALRSPEDLDKFIRSVAETARVHRTTLRKARRGKITHEQTRELAMAYGEDEEKVAELFTRGRGKAYTAEEIDLLKETHIRINREYDDAMEQARKLIEDGKPIPAALEERIWNLAHMDQGLLHRVSAAAAEAGRALNVFQMIRSGERGLSADAMRQLIEEAGGSFADFIKATSGLKPGARVQIINSMFKPKFWDAVREFRISAMLTAVSTHFRNFNENVFKPVAGALAREVAVPFDVIRAGASRAVGGAGKRSIYAGEGLAQLKGWVAGGREGLSTGASSWWKGTSTLLESEGRIGKHMRGVGGFTKMDIPKQSAFARRATDSLLKKYGKTGVRGMRKLSLDLLVGLDETFKVMAGSGELYAQAWRAAKRTKKDPKVVLEQFLKGNFPADVRRAMKRRALEDVFQDRGGRFQKAFQQLRGKKTRRGFGPLMEIIAFAHTQLRIMKYIADWFGAKAVGQIGKRAGVAFREGKSMSEMAQIFLTEANADELAEAVVKPAMTLVTYQMAAEMVDRGILRGTLPYAGYEGRFEREHGIQPRSIRIGDKTMSLERNFFGQMLSILADVHVSLNSEDANAVDKALLVFKSVSENFAKGGVAQSVIDAAKAIEALGWEGHAAAAWMEDYVLSYMPNISRTAADLHELATSKGQEVPIPEYPDPATLAFRKKGLAGVTSGLTEKVKRRLPVARQTLSPMETEFGEPRTRPMSGAAGVANLLGYSVQTIKHEPQIKQIQFYEHVASELPSQINSDDDGLQAYSIPVLRELERKERRRLEGATITRAEDRALRSVGRSMKERGVDVEIIERKKEALRRFYRLSYYLALLDQDGPRQREIGRQAARNYITPAGWRQAMAEIER